MKKIAGLIFIALAVFLGLVFITQIPTIIGITLGAFSGDAHAIGYLAGTLFWWVLFLGGVYFLFKYGIRWVKNKRTFHPTAITLDEDLIKRDSEIS